MGNVMITKWVDPKTAVLKEHVNRGQKVNFQYFRDDEFWYKTDKGLLFPIALKEVQAGKATFLNEDKALYFMRWIRKYITKCKEENTEG